MDIKYDHKKVEELSDTYDGEVVSVYTKGSKK